jgi:hypothetical protein
MDDDGDERSEQVRNALVKVVAAVVVIGLVIALGTTLVVRALGLNESDSPGPVGAAPAEPVEPLPTTAIPVPGEDSEDADPAEVPRDDASPGAGDIQLDISPVMARPMERVNLTGTYKGADNLQLRVQRFEDGKWTDFGVSANVRVGTFETFVMTRRVGEHRFRMYDPEAKQGSNVVLVTID